MTKISKTLNLKTVPCPLNVVKCKLALEKLSKTESLLVDLDKGEPYEMVKASIGNMGYKIHVLKEEKDSFVLKISHDFL